MGAANDLYTLPHIEQETTYLVKLINQYMTQIKAVNLVPEANSYSYCNLSC